MNSSVIREYLVALGFKIDPSSQRVFTSMLTAANTSAQKAGEQADKTGRQFTRSSQVISVAIVAAATAVVTATSRMSASLEQLYYDTQRLGSSTQSIKSFEYGVSQMGGTVDSAKASLEGFTTFLRSNPMSGGLIRSLGVATTDENGRLRNTADILDDIGVRLSKMPYYAAKAYAGVLGIDESTLMAMQRGISGYREEFDKLYASMGINAEKMEKDAVAQERRVRYLKEYLNLLKVSVLGDSVRKLTEMLASMTQGASNGFSGMVQGLRNVVDWILRITYLVVGSLFSAFTLLSSLFERLDKATDGWASKLAALYLGLKAVSALGLVSLFTTLPGLILAAAVALGALYDDYKTWKDGGDSLINWQRWEEDINNVKGFINGLINKLGELKTQAEVLKGGFIGAVIGGLIGLVSPVPGGMLAGAVMGGLGGSLGGWFNQKGAELRGETTAPSNYVEKTSSDKTTNKNNDGKNPLTDNVRFVMDYLVQSGYSVKAAAGLAARAMLESGGGEDIIAQPDHGDGGKAVAAMQWHPARQGEYKKVFGGELTKANLLQQLQFMRYELEEGEYKNIGAALNSSASFTQAGEIASRGYAKPFKKQIEAQRTADLANKVGESYLGADGTAGGVINVTNETTINVNGAGDPQGVGRAVAGEQKRVYADGTRNLSPVVW